MAWFTTLRTANFYLPNIIVTVLITIWGLRLFYHIIKRNLGKKEDFRYLRNVNISASSEIFRFAKMIFLTYA